MNRKTFVAQGAAVLAGALAVRPAAALARGDSEIRLAKQFSMGYLQFNVMEHEQLIEKHAKRLGVPDVKVSWLTFNGPDAMNAALLSDSVDVVAGGVPGLLTLWDRTKGTPQEVKGISALSSQPFLLNTRNPNVRSIADFSASDRIAVPAIKVSVQAVVLQMAAAKLYGQAHYDKLDPLTVSMSPSDATIALESGAAGITSAFSVPPYQYLQLEHPGIRTVLNSYDVLDGPHSFTVVWTSSRFREKNATLYKALVAALEEATDLVSKDTRTASQFWLDDAKAKFPLDSIARMAAGVQVKWTMVPQNTMKFAAFMTHVGTIKNAPGAWSDYFFPEIHRLHGS